MYKRKACQTLKARLSEPRRFLQVLVGPRQVGKTTVVRQLLDNIAIPYLYLTADAVPATNLGWIGDSWELARTRMRIGHHDEYLLVIDEIQKIESWSDAIKKEWDADTFNGTNMKVLILGSSRVMLEQGLSDSMAGRFEEVRIGHWTFGEMREAFGWGVEEYIYYGGYPGSVPLVSDRERWADYIGSSIIDATIHKDVLMGASVAKPALLRQAFEMGAAYSGKVLSYTKMMGALQDAGNTTTLAGYLALLNAAGLLAALPKYTADMARRRASQPKFQVYNSALRSRFASLSLDETLSRPDEWGRCVESAVGAHLVSQSFVKGYGVMYWRDGDDEIDFVLRKGEKLVAIEVKSNRETYTGAMAVFREKYKPHSVVLVGPEGIGIEEFLSSDPSDLFR
jgi:predicted AAA+ superfamily ATPase